MIEVVPFFHTMAFTILDIVGEDNPEAVIATTITSYALSSILTGLVFFIMGSCRFGYIVGFIPRHILIGCIGGVGYFLVATGLEITARLDGNLDYDSATLHKMLEPDTLPLWIIPLSLSVILYCLQKRIDSKLTLPIFILLIPAVFYFFVGSLDQLNPGNLRKSGWIFEGPEAGEPWWYFYTLYSMCQTAPTEARHLVNHDRIPPCSLGSCSPYHTSYVRPHIFWYITRSDQYTCSCFLKRRRQHGFRFGTCCARNVERFVRLRW